MRKSGSNSRLTQSESADSLEFSSVHAPGGPPLLPHAKCGEVLFIAARTQLQPLPRCDYFLRALCAGFAELIVPFEIRMYKYAQGVT
jgi:hypothetical protein